MSATRCYASLLLFAACFALFAAKTAHAFCLAPQLKVSDEYFVSNFVITGAVISQRLEVDPQDPEGSTGTYYVIHVEKVWRGTPPQLLTLYSENSTGRFPMALHGNYILFVTQTYDGKWFIDNCGNSGELPLANKIQTAVRRLPLHQSYVYGDVYQSWKAPNTACPPMRLIVANARWQSSTIVKTDCSFQLQVPPGNYHATISRNGFTIPANDLDYKDPYCFTVPKGGSAGLAFRITNGADAMNLDMIRKDDQRYRDLCSKQPQPQEPAGDYVLTAPETSQRTPPP